MQSAVSRARLRPWCTRPGPRGCTATGRSGWPAGGLLGQPGITGHGFFLSVLHQVGQRHNDDRARPTARLRACRGPDSVSGLDLAASVPVSGNPAVEIRNRRKPPVNVNDAQLIEIMTAQHGSAIEDDAPKASAPGQGPAGTYDVVIEGNAGRQRDRQLGHALHADRHGPGPDDHDGRHEPEPGDRPADLPHANMGQERAGRLRHPAERGSPRPIRTRTRVTSSST